MLTSEVNRRKPNEKNGSTGLFNQLSRRTVNRSADKMLSRLALRNAQALPAIAHGAQALSSSSEASNRPVRAEFGGKVRLGFIPDEWFTYFYPKTGVTGPYAFGLGLTTYLVSKEIYVMEHEYYTGLSILLMCIYGVKKFGPAVAAYADKLIDEQITDLNESKNSEIEYYESSIKDEKHSQWQAEGQTLLMEAKKQNIAMQLEAAYRERLAHVYSEVKKRLDYQVQIQAIERRISQKHMSEWIISNVLKSITPEQEKATLQQCIVDLQGLAART
ncbi:ATP synthase subunit b, mitochondrial [Neodiprion lecontei]|uniref:ATP synthase subunit b n=1 Tax=Neodiprion lecontei TaxID=441921 RepID=A0A6J0C3F7_NEOLC|nr:ATP synthase subunit b, mitochondrial [Neodiprion lecontei]